MDFASWVDAAFGRQDAEIRKYMREVMRDLAGLKSAQKKQILKEIRSHIDEKMEDAIKEVPAMSRDTIAKRILFEFGMPEEIAKAYFPDGFAPRKKSTAVKIANVCAILIAVMFVSISAIAIISMTEEDNLTGNSSDGDYSPDQNSNTTVMKTVYDYRAANSIPSSSSDPWEEIFDMPENVTGFLLKIESHKQESSMTKVNDLGSVTIEVINPLGEVVYSEKFETLNSETNRGDLEPISGTWTVRYTYQYYSGTVSCLGTATISCTN
jgi:hypothetical protein